ncbi:hypothetical protein V0288_11785 [Pannus brasiliensis CCIBt3594]|uniref:DNA-binding protein n=1 Tax=Pannus brasiliensis CCIBt3594 TaxID=1427578 RepID=A0AAW9QRF3_9CHRO
MVTRFVGKGEASRCLNLSDTTLKRYRLQGLLVEGIHWVRLNSRCIRYNLDLLQDWIQNRHDPKAHQKAIDIYQANLLANREPNESEVLANVNPSPTSRDRSGNGGREQGKPRKERFSHWKTAP